MAWILLIVAGLFEVCWAVGLKYTDGFRRILPSVLVVISIVASMIFLSLAVRSIPIGTAYAVWVGIGVLGAAVLGIILFQDSVTLPRLVFLSLLLVSMIGLKLTAPGN